MLKTLSRGGVHVFCCGAGMSEGEGGIWKEDLGGRGGGTERCVGDRLVLSIDLLRLNGLVEAKDEVE